MKLQAGNNGAPHRTEKRTFLWFTWNHEKAEKSLEHLSSQGLHLVKPGLFRSAFVRDNTNRYVYRFDYQPEIRRQPQVQEYINLYTDSGWEHVGSCMSWHYFRRRWQAGESHEIYTDKTSLVQLYKRIQRVLGIVCLCEFPVFFVNANNLLQDHSQSHMSTALLPVLTLDALIIFLLAYGCYRMSRKIKGITAR